MRLIAPHAVAWSQSAPLVLLPHVRSAPCFMVEAAQRETVAEIRRRLREDEEKQKASAARRADLVAKLPQLGVFAAFAALTAAALAYDAPPRAMLARAFAGCLACVLPGVYDTHLAVSYGYGASMLWHAALVAPTGGGAGRLLGLAYAAYGIKVLLFQALRDARPDYVARALPQRQEARERRRGGGVHARRLGFVVSVATLLRLAMLLVLGEPWQDPVQARPCWPFATLLPSRERQSANRCLP